MTLALHNEGKPNSRSALTYAQFRWDDSVSNGILLQQMEKEVGGNLRLLFSLGECELL
jgi:hypothetical protein